jgi:hypothetical protein
LSRPVAGCERDGSRFSPIWLMAGKSIPIGLSCGRSGTRCCCCCWPGCCCCGSRRGSCSRCCSDRTQKAQNESSPLLTNSFFTDAMRPPRRSLFNSSFALLCPFTGIWMNSNDISRFFENIFVRGCTSGAPLWLPSFFGLLFKILHAVSLSEVVPHLDAPALSFACT